jgi:small-conductance mechanosensitive channel
MEPYHTQLIETVIVAIGFLLLRYTSLKSIDNVSNRFQYSKSRMKITKKLVKVLISSLAIASIILVWGVNQSKLLYFISSLLTVLGVALFAQWSILSNITATIIVFFSFPAKIGDTIAILEKDSLVEGRISDIGIFFVLLKTKDGEVVSIPSNLFIQKVIKRKDLDLEASTPDKQDL